MYVQHGYVGCVMNVRMYTAGTLTSLLVQFTREMTAKHRLELGKCVLVGLNCVCAVKKLIHTHIQTQTHACIHTRSRTYTCTYTFTHITHTFHICAYSSLVQGEIQVPVTMVYTCACIISEYVVSISCVMSRVPCVQFTPFPAKSANFRRTMASETLTRLVCVCGSFTRVSCCL